MLKAVLFDLDGVIIDTERHGHRVAFNQALAELGYPDAVWDEALYHRLLQVGGGKERIRHYFETLYPGPPPPDVDDFVRRAHRRKTDLFLELLPDLPLRPGVLRFMRDIRDRGLAVAICTTSNERVAAAVAARLEGIPVALILAGDMVARKKPDPEIYLTAVARLGIAPGEGLVVEDSRIGVTAGAAAGCRVLATYNGYTEAEDLSAADTEADCLGEPGGPPALVRRTRVPVTRPVIDAAYLDACS